MQNKNIVRHVIITASLLLIPLLGKWSWSLSDFIIAGVLIFGSGVIYELIVRKPSSTSYRIAAGSAVVTGLLLIWVNLAVGLIGNENNPANLMYFGVLAIGLIGVSVARLEARGMFRALLTTAIAQALVPIIAMIIWRPPFNLGLIQVFGVNTFFVALWIGSALLFRRASITIQK